MFCRVKHLQLPLTAPTAAVSAHISSYRPTLDPEHHDRVFARWVRFTWYRDVSGVAFAAGPGGHSGGCGSGCLVGLALLAGSGLGHSFSNVAG